MLPSHTQRFLMLLAVAVGTPVWWWAGGSLTPADGLSGWALSDAERGLIGSAVLLVFTALPAVAAAGFIAATGNPLSGVFSAALAATIAHHSNAFVGVARRAADTTAEQVYGRLAVEMGVGVGLLLILLIGIEVVRKWSTKRVPDRLQSRHLGEEVCLWKIDGKSVVAGLITAALGGVITVLLVQHDDPQQVVGGLVLAFTVAALIGHTVSPNHRPVPTLVVPAIVGVVGYLWALRQLGSSNGESVVLSALYADTLPGVAVALPLHYLTAGVLGCALGIGIGQVVEKAKIGGL